MVVAILDTFCALRNGKEADMTEPRETLERRLNDFDPAIREAALDMLLEQTRSGAIALPPRGRGFNLHCHTFFSYNGYGLSPSGVVWKALCEGFCAVGLVDFDVLDGVDEFLKACRKAGLRANTGIETRVFVPPFAGRSINSPGEPGISYHMGIGFVPGPVADAGCLEGLLQVALARNRKMTDRINAYLEPVQLDYDRDVLPLTPNGNATERHVCQAYDLKAEACFPDRTARIAFWAERLGLDRNRIAEILDNGPVFQGMVRAKTMKAGGPGYVQPEGKDFPTLARVNEFILANGAIPTYAFLDGASDGEQAIEELLDVMMESGVAAVNIIPDRNWNFKDPEVRRAKAAELDRFVSLAHARHLPISVGTEMNAHGQRFVDDFDTPELAKHYDIFLEGARIFHAHTLLQAHAGMGYTSTWASRYFDSACKKNLFYARLGAAVERWDGLPAAIAPEWTPLDILAELDQ